MQERLTSSKFYESFIYAKRHKKLLKLAIVILIVFALIFVLIARCLPDEKTENCYAKATYYFLSLYSDKREVVATANQSKVTSVGGAGYIFFKDNFYHVIAFCYDDYSKAQESKELYEQEFSKASILTIESGQLPVKKIRIIERNKVLKAQFLELCEIPSMVCGIYDSYIERQDIGECYKAICKLEEDLSYLLVENERFKDDNEIGLICEIYNPFIVRILEHITECKEELYINSAIQKNLNLLYIEVCLLEAELRDSLKSL